ncbi:hypothetical protein OSB04_022986 [Centaurea solstitialis]|uniref:Uncharacterized protein n=1 Tax=Centaurea solstitialis TaxID=347529 RepID=A0AA38SJY8_9ASTR|nr:hypothetical protein OSB04_022986 [Centaurea solstitialis]
MDAINKCKCFISPQISIEMLLNGRIPLSAWIRLQTVYASLCNVFVMAMFGCFFVIPFNTGGWITALGFIATLSLISIINPHMEIRRAILLNVAAFFFGATVAPLINLFIQMDHSTRFPSPSTPSMASSRFLAAFFHKPAADVVTVPFHLGCVWLLYYFLSTLFLISCFLLQNVYLFVVPLIVHTQMHSQHVVAHHTKESYIVNTTISFFTDFPAVPSLYSCPNGSS